MPTLLNIGSLNIDFVYTVSHFVRPGETLSSSSFTRGAGGKGLNQSIAAARAGAAVRHIGRIGMDGRFLGDLLFSEGVDIAEIQMSEGATGHAIIQVNQAGENAILFHPGANAEIDLGLVESAISEAKEDDLLLLQNETNGLDEILQIGRNKGLRMILNTAPITENLLQCDLSGLWMLICNETEGQALTGQSSPKQIIQSLRATYPETIILMTLGAEGCCCLGPNQDWDLPAQTVTPVDTTAAGDTFVGYLCAGLAHGQDLFKSAKIASQAAAITVTRTGAAASIPYAKELVSEKS